MKIIKKIFPKNKQNQTLRLPQNQSQINEYTDLLKQATNYENELQELVQERIMLQISLNQIKNKKCENCLSSTSKINELLIQKQKDLAELALLREEFKRLQDMKTQEEKKKYENKIEEDTVWPEFQKYFIMNNIFYVCDKKGDMYNLTKCNKYQEYLKESQKSLFDLKIKEDKEGRLMSFIDIYNNNN